MIASQMNLVISPEKNNMPTLTLASTNAIQNIDSNEKSLEQNPVLFCTDYNLNPNPEPRPVSWLNI